jgi:ElaB/YqjD/DUF883 family membrane-anchored ribosome-binding protein
MIAPVESFSKTTRFRSLGIVTTASGENSPAEPNVADKTLRLTKQWVEKHPTSAVVVSVVLGLLAGYAVKRFGR